MILLYALLQSAVVPPRLPEDGVRPLFRMPLPEELVEDRPYPRSLPSALIDFLGRRRICAERAADEGEDAEDQRRFLSCETLQSEEAEWRRRFAGDAAVVAALNQDPSNYRIPRFLSTFDGSPSNVQVRRFAQEGVEPESGTAVSVVVERTPDRPGAIRVTASWGNVAARTVELPVADLPNFDITSVSLRLRPDGEHPGLGITANFGRHRGYCWDGSDDRPSVSIFFTPTRVSASRQGWPRCNPSHETFPVATVAASHR